MASGHFEFAILGAGAIGSILGAHLARSGRSVVMLARGQRAQDIKRLGLRIRGLVDLTQPVPVLTEPLEFAGADVLIVATKALGTREALARFRHARIGVAFSVQNGLVKNDYLADTWGGERVLGAIADTSGELLSTGETLFTRNEELCIGERSGGPGERARHIAAVIDESGVRTSAVADIQSLEWSKFAAWAALMVLSVATRAATWKYLVDPDLASVLLRLMREMAALAAAHGISLSDRAPLPVSTLVGGSDAEGVALIQALGHRFKSNVPEHRMSTLQDLDAGRPLEIEETLGYAARDAERMNLSLPLLQSLYPLAAGIGRIPS
ncbi:MAG TPA: 2-dehydropantoate 2-reductase [Steroidobacteraceae bacterium]|jgi:2-dehydropantoate 2-reductase|nr:2-dehydropantoate 2-reductase [Steroidobacteraceae bacterium]